MFEAEGIDPAVFARLLPSQFLSFSFPNPLPSPQTPYSKTLRLAVADSPSPPPPPSPPAIAAILVPPRREHDWLFSTAAGHFQLLLSSSSPILPISRLLLIGNLPNPSSSPSPHSYSRSETDRTSLDSFQQTLFPLLLALCPKSAFLDGIPSIPFLSYEDDLIRCTPVEKLVGPSAGEMLVEDVEIEDAVGSSELRRRLRFKKMPNLIQTQVRLLPEDGGLVFRPEMGSLAQPYLGLMVSALFLNGFGIDEAFRSGGGVPWVLCVGVGGGPLLMCLRCGFGFRVLGVEMDDAVLRVARRHFGLVEGDLLKVVVDDGIKLMEDCAVGRSESELFHAIMVDLDEEDPMNGVGAPPAEFLEMSVLVGARRALHPDGILVVNVIFSDELLYARMIELFRRVFCELYELKVDDGENFVVVATVSPVGSVAKEMKKQGRVYEKLKQLDCERFIDGIRKI